MQIFDVLYFCEHCAMKVFFRYMYIRIYSTIIFMLHYARLSVVYFDSFTAYQ